ncbi:MAG: type II toxin-antitoxin system HicA family toxin [Pyrinomonadaceae bacterium]
MPRIAPVSYRILVCIFELAGFKCVREEGDHMIFTRIGVLRPIVIPKYRSIPVFIIKNNLRTSGMTRDRYFELFKKCS